MHRVARTGRAFALAALVLAVAACADQRPTPQQMAADVARLDAVVPVLEDLRVTDFEDSAFCRNLAYARGAFGNLAQEGCEREGTGQFDEAALADHARVALAIAATGVTTDRMQDVTYDAEGSLETARIRLVEASVTENWEYLYDPTGVVPKQNVDGQAFSRIAPDWWFVSSRDD
jgi:hypothetical protein